MTSRVSSLQSIATKMTRIILFAAFLFAALALAGAGCADINATWSSWQDYRLERGASGTNPTLESARM